MQQLDGLGSWDLSWAWGVPLTVATVVVHVLGLVLIRAAFGYAFSGPAMERGSHLVRFSVAMGVAVLMTTVLHVIEAMVWAGAYVALGAAPSVRGAMLYSLNAMTAYGHTAVFLVPDWQMLGALQALNGLILFGLSTAFLYGMSQDGWPGRAAQDRARPQAGDQRGGGAP